MTRDSKFKEEPTASCRLWNAWLGASVETLTDGHRVPARVDDIRDDHATRLNGVEDAVGEARNEQSVVAPVEARSVLRKEAEWVECRSKWRGTTAPQPS